MARLGVQFQKPAPAVQASLDRAVFALMRQKAEAQRGLQDGERRVSTRVEITDQDQLAVELLPDRPRGVLSTDKPASGPDLTLLNVEVSGKVLYRKS